MEIKREESGIKITIESKKDFADLMAYGNEDRTDAYTSELFENFTGVNDACTFSELVVLAEDFITTIGNDFQGISIDYEAKDYALQYVKNNHLQSHLAS